MNHMLTINQKAPAFSLPDETGKVHRLADYKGHWVVLYFYPKDNTSGCTKEANAIAQAYKTFTAMEVVVIGVSKDSPVSHATFKEKQALPFTLLSDESTKMIQKYGAWKEKTLYGRHYMGTDRVTYIISPEGKIAKVYPKVKPAEHALQLIADLQALIITA